MGLPKITALTMCLCKLHNFCIDERELEIPQSLCQDKAYGMCKGGGSEYQFEPNDDFPEELVPNPVLHGGEHWDDFSKNALQNLQRQEQRAKNLPREQLFNLVMEKNLVRPASTK